MQLKQIRAAFLNYFANNGHEIVNSSPLVPHNDPTLMFTNAGMVQFKNYFTGVEIPKYSRAATSQKCVRAGGKHNDLENVGYTARHHTFFEMLGNFSFGDYFKDEAINFAWQCITKEFAIDKSRLYVTIYHDDEEAYKIWKKVAGLSDDRIIKIATSDNFWAMGDTGPCGPCSEIFYDNGDHIPGGLPGTADQDGDRYKEIWNLVFMQFEDTKDRGRIKLPKPSIDTGMGLERIAAVLQGKTDNFEIDLFQNIINASKNFSGYAQDSVSHRVIADHLRASSFLIADGVMPSNEGRGYVLRRIMRRAMRHIHNLRVREPMFYKLVPTLISEMADSYPELKRAEAVISSTLKFEEEKFIDTLDKGLKILNEELTSVTTVLPGTVAFKLYDTYGFPLDLTADILKAKSITVDTDGFEKAMQEQKQRAKAAWVGSGEKTNEQIWFDIIERIGATEFLGYTLDAAQCIIKAIVKDGKETNSLPKGQEGWLVLNQTPFYAESGGQVGDKGKINGSEVKDVQKFAKELFAHKVLADQTYTTNEIVEANIDNQNRSAIRANHSATHLLHKALRNVLGAHVTQKGSLVTADKLRFDFSHNHSLSRDELSRVELIVNQMIIANSPAITEISSPEEAQNQGAMALFGEKYGEKVRVVKIGETLELCGGTHVNATGDIGTFKLVSESALASGIRRIEAITHLTAVQNTQQQDAMLKQIADIFKCAAADVPARIEHLMEERKALTKQISNLHIKAATQIKPNSKHAGGVNFGYHLYQQVPAGELKTIADTLKQHHQVLVLGSIVDDKLNIVITVAANVAEKVNASNLVKHILPIINGNGGGRAEFAQASGANKDAFDSAIAAILSLYP